MGFLGGTEEWKLRRDAKLAERQGKFTLATKQLDIILTYPSPSTKLSILSSSAPQLVKGIQEKKWTSSDIIYVFVERILQTDAAINAVTEALMVEALEQATKLDKQFAKTGKLVGPLHGVPCTFKDQYAIEGVDNTIGFTHQTTFPSRKDAHLVKLIRDQGGIIIAKSSVPQTMLSFECSNPLFGITRNPYSPSRIPGGSSGGEAALLASDSSALGFGSDIGGSLRIPAAFSGCYGLKPCWGRFPDAGAKTANPGFEGIRGSLGPMGRCMEDIELASRIVFDASPSFSRTLPIVPIKYREVALPKRLKFGYYKTDGFCRASPAVSRAVQETIDALERQGHDCVEFEPPRVIEAMEIFVALTSSDGYSTLLSGLQGDPKESSLFLVTLGPKIPWFLRTFVAYIFENWMGDDQMATLLRASRVKSVRDMQTWVAKRNDYVRDWREQAVPALKHGETWNLSPLSIGTILYNVVESSAGVVPVTFVDPEKDSVTPDFLKRGQPGAPLVEKRVYGPGGVYDAKAMAGLPVGVQVVGAAFEEEKVIEMMKVVDKALGPRGFGPGEFVKKFPAFA